MLKGFVSLTMAKMETGERHFPGYHSNFCKEENMLHEKHES